METARGLDALERSDRPVFVVVGVFDGLHLGHAYLLEHLVREAAAREARPLVITFDHHPDEILTGSAPPLLCDPEERLTLLAAAGVDATVVVHFDQQLRETTYDAFVAQVAARAPLAGFLMTPDAAFGYRREGTPDALAELGRTMGFEVVVIPPFDIDGRHVRSTDVRADIASGDIAAAARLLGREPAVVGVAERASDERIRVRFELPVALPPDGRYRVLVTRNGRALEGAGPAEEGVAVVQAGDLWLAGGPQDGRVRVAFVARR